MRADKKYVAAASLPYIDVDENDDPSVTRAEYEQLVEISQTIAAQADTVDVTISLPMFDRMLRAIAVGLLHGG